MSYLETLNDEQRAVVYETEGNKAVVAGAGCITGDTEIRFNRAGKGFKTTIKKAFESFNHPNPMKGNSGWAKSIKTYVRSFKSHVIQLHEIEGIVYSGNKRVYELILENGYKLKATKCHKIMTQDGWVRLGDLTKEHYVMCDTLKPEKCPNSKKRYDKIIRSLDYYPYGSKCKNDKRRTEEHRLAYEAGINGLSLEDMIYILRNDEAKAKKLSFLIPELDVYHINGICTDNRFENLIAVSKNDHSKLHKDEQYKCFNQGKPKYSKVVSTKYLGFEDTYDIQCLAPFHNFVANGMVIHNSGKTRVIIAKVIHLIQDKDIPPNNIWICTFTKKAKEELVERLSKEVGASIAKKVKIGTLHSISFSIYKNGLVLVDKRNRKMLPRPLVNEGTALFQIFNFIRANEKKVHSRDGKDFLSTINVRRMYGVTLENYQQFCKFEPEHRKGDRWCYNETIFRVWQHYEKWKINNNWIDFGDMLVRCAEMLKDPKYMDYVSSLQRNCNYIMIDEAQDNNAINYQIAEVLSAINENLTVVGDSRQAIYSFQGASLDNLHNFIKKKKPKIFNLKTNYRSTSTIVDNANKFIQGSAGIIGEPSVAFQGEGMPIKFCTSEDESSEAGNVFHLVQELVETRGYDYKDIAILYRVHSQSVMLESYFLHTDIPYVTFTENTFFDKKEIKDIILYLKAFQDPDSLDFKEMKRIMQRPNRYISSKAFQELEKYSEYEDQTTWESLQEVQYVKTDARNRRCFQEFRNQIVAGVNRYQANTNVTDLIQFILKQIGYEDWINGEKENKNPDSDVVMDFDAIINLVNSFEKLEDFFAYVDKVREQEEVRKGQKDGNFLQMMTHHASKGKEFPVVITLGNCTRIAPFHRNADREEEKRLMYVAITRPEKELYVSVIGHKLGRFKVQPSPFLWNFQASYEEDYSGRFYSFD
ncbi:MAG: UvrD-helicase domain-containing protein [Pseudoalteromonas sp.]|uniref:ATP-dependent helicase n=1 Tax=Pseudoalteromonas sp. TaxID=53249 RepID=UPI001D1AD4EF|nr:UvrD-helicase domain-containing protein [Pseudoalteromonas sp.]NRA76909.1 UvrD-helicase domain-containing protein [Pseudoalteromonas sp.]